MKLAYRIFLDSNPAIDEYCDEGVGIYMWGWCLVGLLIRAPHDEATGEGEAWGIILFNYAAGIWRDPNPDEPPSVPDWLRQWRQK
jgi:hypothetical protein